MSTVKTSPKLHQSMSLWQFFIVRFVVLSIRFTISRASYVLSQVKFVWSCYAQNIFSVDCSLVFFSLHLKKKNAMEQQQRSSFFSGFRWGGTARGSKSQVNNCIVVYKSLFSFWYIKQAFCHIGNHSSNSSARVNKSCIFR